MCGALAEGGERCRVGNGLTGHGVRALRLVALVDGGTAGRERLVGRQSAPGSRLCACSHAWSASTSHACDSKPGISARDTPEHSAFDRRPHGAWDEAHTKYSQCAASLEPISQFSKCAVFLGFDVHGPSGGCKIWFQKTELKKDLTRLRSEAKTSLFFLMTTQQQPPRARREMTSARNT